ncbi:MAG: hypothetical protein J7M25_07305 [Deltaproteobacteria bacterium]|nr:hypothetical protein [Deltaproteobacteria bacterium]
MMRLRFSARMAAALAGLWVVAALALGYYVAADVSYNKVAAPPLDDTFIHFQYAKQIARGRFFRYQDGDSVSTGATSFLYPILLAPFWAVGFKGLSLIWAAHFLNLIGLAAAMSFVFLILRRLIPDDPVLAYMGGLAVALNGWFMWGVASGMAIAVSAGLLAAVLYFVLVHLQENRPWPAAVSLCLLAMVRPEGLVLAYATMFAFVLHRILRSGSVSKDDESAGDQAASDDVSADETSGDDGVGSVEPTSAIDRLRRLSGRAWSGVRHIGWLLWVGLGLGTIPTIVLAVASGHLTTNGMLVKSHFAHDMDWVRYLWETGRTIAAVPGRLLWSASGLLPPVMFLAVLAALANLLRKTTDESKRRQALAGFGIVLAGAFLAIITFYGFLIEHIEHHERYYMPYVPLVVVSVVVGLSVVAQAVSHAGRSAFRRTAMVAILVIGIGGLGKWARVYAHNCGDIAGHYLPMTKWMRSHLPKDAKVAVHDAGALFYLSGRRCYDMIGLVTNDFRPPGGARAGGFIWEMLERIHPGYMVIYPNFLPSISRLPILRKIHEVRLARITIAGGHVKTAYRIEWNRLMPPDRPAHLPGPYADWTMVDALDEADLVSERAHAYVVDHGRFHGASRFRLVPFHEGAGLLIDGGRAYSGHETFTLHGVKPGQPLLIGLRSDFGRSLDLEVRIDGHVVGTWRIGTSEHRRNHEAFLPIAAKAITKASPRVKLRPIGGTDLATFHIFALQPKG